MLIEECKAHIEKLLPELTKELMLESWQIECEYDARIDGATLADINLDNDYKTALIRFDAAKIRDELELKRVLTHELCHLIQAPIDFYRSLRAQESDLEYRLYTNALENVVTHLERIFMARSQ
jgi:predicted SprT family Zn-dependent metalloprotease